jgi:hypothetical protein
MAREEKTNDERANGINIICGRSGGVARQTSSKAGSAAASSYRGLCAPVYLRRVVHFAAHTCAYLSVALRRATSPLLLYAFARARLLFTLRAHAAASRAAVL